MSSQTGALTEPQATAGDRRLARRLEGRFAGPASGPERHQEQGQGWRASWEEGAESLSLEREPLSGSRGAAAGEPSP